MNFSPLALPSRDTGLVAPKAWIPKLNTLVKGTMRREDISEVEALLVRVAGDFVAGIVLYRLLLWFPSGKRKDGGIYKSDKAMNAELGVSYSQMARVREVLADLLEIEVKKAHGSPTCHYWLRSDVLVEKIAEIYATSPMLIRVLIFEKVENGFSGKSRMVSQESRESITTIQTTKKTNVVVDRPALLPPLENKVLQLHPVAQMLAELGIAGEIAGQYSDVDVVALRGVIEVAKAKKKARTLQGSVAGYVLGALKAGIAPVVEEKRETWADVLVPVPEFVDIARSPHPLPKKGQGEEDWEMVRDQLLVQVDAYTRAWLNVAQFVSDDGVRVVVRVQDAQSASRAHRQVVALYRQLVGREVQFVLIEREKPVLDWVKG